MAVLCRAIVGVNSGLRLAQADRRLYFLNNNAKDAPAQNRKK